MTTLEHLDHYTTLYIATFLPSKSIKTLSQTSKDMNMRLAHNSRALARTCACCADGPPLEKRIPVMLARAHRDGKPCISDIASSLAAVYGATGRMEDSVVRSVTERACPLLTACMVGGLKAGAMFLLADSDSMSYDVASKTQEMQSCLVSLTDGLRLQRPHITEPRARDSLRTAFGFPAQRDICYARLQDSVHILVRVLLAFSGSAERLLDPPLYLASSRIDIVQWLFCDRRLREERQRTRVPDLFAEDVNMYPHTREWWQTRASQRRRRKTYVH